MSGKGEREKKSRPSEPDHIEEDVLLPFRGNPKIRHGCHHFCSDRRSRGSGSRSFCQTSDLRSSFPFLGWFGADTDRAHFPDVPRAGNDPALFLESIGLDGINFTKEKPACGMGLREYRQTTSQKQSTHEPLGCRSWFFGYGSILEPGQSLLFPEPGMGEESPDTTGYFAPGNRGRFRGDPELTDRVTENRPPDAASCGGG